MKTSIAQNTLTQTVQPYNKILFWRVNIILLIMITSLNNLKAQTPPGVQWLRSYWPDEDAQMNYVERVNSGEDWFYDIKLDKDINGNPQGLICAGYQRDRCDAQDPTSHCGIDFNGDQAGNYSILRDKDHHAGNNKGTLWAMDYEGNKKWYLAYGEEEDFLEFDRVIQASDKNYIVAGYGFSATFGLNPTNSVPNGLPILNTDWSANPGNQRCAYIAKIDRVTHQIIWQYYYNMESNTNVNNDLIGKVKFRDIQEEPGTNNLIAIGESSNDPNIGNGHGRMAIFYLDQNGRIIDKKAVDYINSSIGTTINSDLGGYAIINATGGGFYGAGYTYASINGINGTLGLAVKIEIVNNAITIPLKKHLGNTNFTNTENRNFVFGLTQLTNGKLIVPCQENANVDEPYNVLKIYELNTSNFNVSTLSSITNASLYAYDNQIGVENTVDGGFAVVCSKKWKVPDPVHVITQDGSGTTLCFSASGTFNFPPSTFLYKNTAWNTSALFLKYDANGILEWQQEPSEIVTDFNNTIFPKYDLQTTNRGDITRHECLYKFVQLPDGSFVAAGNNSENLDDHYLIKINSDCATKTNYSLNNGLVITSGPPTIWTTNKTVKGIIDIQPGATLIVNNGITIEFADTRQVNKETRIIIRPGGKLVLKPGATLTAQSTCPNAVWDGVEVLGNPAQEQTFSNGFNTYQGRLEMQGGSTISKSYSAVRLSSSIYKPEKDYAYSTSLQDGGGVLVATSANFIDNFRDVEFVNYHSPSQKANKSLIANCQFRWTGAFPQKAYLYDIQGEQEGHYIGKGKYITMWEVDGVKIIGNNFENTTANEPIHARGTAVVAWDATFTMNSNQDNNGLYIHNTINNLFMGVNASATHPLTHSLAVANVRINNVRHGIGLSSLSLPYPTLLGNIITLNTIPTNAEDNEAAWGIHLTACDNYTVEENNITATWGTNNSINDVYGILANNRHNLDTRLYRNTLTGLKKGITPFGENGLAFDDYGLLIKCNTNNNNLNADISVEEDYLAGTTGTIKMEQGVCFGNDPTTPAGNQFTPQFGSLVHIATDANTTPFNYNHHTGVNYTPQTLGANATPIPCQQSFTSGSCPFNYPPLSNGGGFEYTDPNPQNQKTMADNITALLIDYNIKTPAQKKQIQSEIAALEAKYFDNLARSENGMQQIINYLIAKPHKTSNDNMKLTEAYIANKNNANALSLLNSITDQKLQSKKGLIQKYIELQQQNKTWFSLNKSELQAIKNASVNYASPIANNNYNIHKLVSEKSVKYRIPEFAENANYRVTNTQTIDGNYITVSPNPNKNNFTLTLSAGMAVPAKIVITDVSGKIVLEQVVSEESKFIDVNHNLVMGVYFVQVGKHIVKLLVN
jgi:hypothetical protein